MRNYFLSILSCAALVMACQPITQTPITTGSTAPNLKIKDDTPITPASMAPSVPQAAPSPSVPADTLSPNPVDQNNNQTEIDITISTVTESSETRTNSAQESPDVTPKALAMPKTFDPTEIIGFATPVLVHNLGRANIIRKEGPIEVWQYQLKSCVIDFFFYPIGESSSQLILKTWDMRSTVMGNRLNRGSCRDEINLYHQKFSSNS